MQSFFAAVQRLMQRDAAVALARFCGLFFARFYRYYYRYDCNHTPIRAQAC